MYNSITSRKDSKKAKREDNKARKTEAAGAGETTIDQLYFAKSIRLSKFLKFQGCEREFWEPPKSKNGMLTRPRLVSVGVVKLRLPPKAKVARSVRERGGKRGSIKSGSDVRELPIKKKRLKRTKDFIQDVSKDLA